MGTQESQTQVPDSTVGEGISRSRGISLSRGLIASLAALGDATAVFACGYIGRFIYPGWEAGDQSAYFNALIVNMLLTLAVFYEQGLYTVEAVYRPIKQLRKILVICTAVPLLLFTVAFTFQLTNDLFPFWCAAWVVIFTMSVYLARAVSCFALDISIRRGWMKQYVVIVGGEAHGERLIRHLEGRKEPWVQIVGIFDDRRSRIAPRVGEYDVLGSLQELVYYARQHRVDDVLVALPWSADTRLVDIVHTLSPLPVRVRLCPDAAAYNFLHRPASQYAGILALNVSDLPIEGWRALVKWGMDRGLSLLILLPLLPLIALIALLIKIDSPGPVFFRQQRYGFNHCLIGVYKFRSMRVDQQDDNAATLVTRGDSRVTRIGALLRRTSLDELPQLFNVLRGEMSLVGPRPHALQAKAADKLYQELVSEYAVRHKVKPGITGWAQVNGWRGETDTVEKIEKRVEYDLYYIKHCSPAFDLYILLRTLIAVARCDNAY